MERVFNALVIVALGLTVIYWVIPEIDHFWLSDQELNLLSAGGWGSILPISSFITWPMLILWGVVSVGLLKRIRMFRTLYFGYLLALAVMSFFWGYLVLSPAESGIANILGMLDGAILTMAYFTSVSKSFEKNT